MLPFSPETRVFVAGHRGMVGSAVVRRLRADGCRHLLLADRQRLDLTDQAAVDEFVRRTRPDVVIFAAARVGGIHANQTAPADFLYDNLAMAVNTIQSAWRYGVQRFLYLGSVCIYPRLAAVPTAEDSLLTGALEPTNEAYAIAKIAGLRMCEYYRRQHGALFHSAMPTNLYGPGDNYHPDNSHVIPALLQRIHEAHINGAEQVTIWGTGAPRREFLHVDDLVDGLLHLLSLADPPDLVNIGSDDDISILELAHLIADVVGYRGAIRTDPTRPDGAPRRQLDNTRMRSTGWRPAIDLPDGLAQVYECFLQEQKHNLLRSA